MELSHMSMTRKKAERITADAITFMENALREQRAIDVPDMAEACFLSESHFRRLFTSVTGESPKAYWRRRRLETAAKLLCESEQTVTEISFLCCFTNHSTFYREFLKHYGCNPTKYRETHMA